MNFLPGFNAIEALTAESVEAVFQDVLASTGMKLGQVMPVYRLFVAGRMQGPGMFDVSALLGKDEVTARIQAGLEYGKAWD